MIHPATFQRRALNRSLSPNQVEICKAYSEYTSLSIAGCHASGKSFVVSGLVAHELSCYAETIILVIAPTLRQVKTFWGEIIKAWGSLVYATPEPTTARWQIATDRYAQGFSSSKGVNAQGYHGKRVLIITDEAMGIKPDLWDAIEGVRSGGDVRIVKLLNPTVPSGPVFDDFGKNRGVRGHKCINISAFDTPNFAGVTLEALLKMTDEELDVCPAPHLIRRRWVREMYEKWGPTNPRFQSRVLGQFPTQASDSVFHLDWIEQAGQPYEPDELKPHLRPGLYIQVGLDIAGPGNDETAVTARIGPYVIARGAWSKPDAVQEVLEFLGRLRVLYIGASIIIMADTVGIGYHFARQIAKYGFDVRSFIAGAAPLDPVMFKNQKAEQYWVLREWMREGFVKGVEDEDTKAQLSDIRYRELAGGQIEIEHKDEARARGSNSPDRAESLVMAFARIVPRQTRQEINVPDEIQAF